MPVPHGGRLKPVAALRGWLAAAAIAEGPVFRPIDKTGRVRARRLTDRSVANIVKRHCTRAGLDPSVFSGHSLRAGFVTSALEHGADAVRDVMPITRHRDVHTMLDYDRRVRAFKNHAGRKFL